MKKYTCIVVTVSIILIAAFFLMPQNKDVRETAKIPAATAAERLGYFASHGWAVDELYSQNITIPEVFSAAYEGYADLQDKQGLPLRRHKGEAAELFVYRVNNYGEGMLAELIVCDGIITASMIYSEEQGVKQLAVQ